MNFLFDVSPTEDGGRKSSRKRSCVIDKPQSESEPAFVHVPKRYEAGFQPIIGTIDHTYDCGDAACGTQCHDILREEKGQWYVVCAFCGTGQWVEALVVKEKKQAKPQDGVFRLQGGRFPGMTLDEVSLLDDGLGCIRWWAADKRASTPDSVRAAAKAWLDESEKKHLDASANTL